MKKFNPAEIDWKNPKEATEAVKTFGFGICSTYLEVINEEIALHSLNYLIDYSPAFKVGVRNKLKASIQNSLKENLRRNKLRGIT